MDVKNWFHIFLQVQNAPGLTTMLHAQKDGQITDWNAKRLPPTKPVSLHIFKSLRRFGWPPLPWQGLCSERLSFALDSIADKKKAEKICEVDDGGCGKATRIQWQVFWSMAGLLPLP